MGGAARTAPPRRMARTGYNHVLRLSPREQGCVRHQRRCRGQLWREHAHAGWPAEQEDRNCRLECKTQMSALGYRKSAKVRFFGGRLAATVELRPSAIR